MDFETNHQFALQCDNSSFHCRDKFSIPNLNNKEVIYLCGHSLGLMPLSCKPAVSDMLDVWAENGILGYFKDEKNWQVLYEDALPTLGELVGAKRHEIMPMNSLTTNIHLLMLSMYRPTQTRFKILIEDKAFPSDHYAAQSQCEHHGISPDEGLVTFKADPKTQLIDETALIDYLDKHGDEIAVVLLPAVQYYTGQALNIAKITHKAHAKGCIIGFDCAHAVGNIPLSLHDDQVDFAVWCHYKYLNSGPAAIGGAYLHEKHGLNETVPRLKGWWGHDRQSRFMMDNQFVPEKGLASWQLSNQPTISLTTVLSSLSVFQEIGIKRLREKSIKLTAYLEFLLQSYFDKEISIITPTTQESRGAQLSLQFHQNGKSVYEALKAQGVITDWREPNVMRVAPVPLYNTFEDVYHFVNTLKSIIKP